jgi:hypothetical protein
LAPLSVSHSNTDHQCCADFCCDLTVYNRHKSKLTPNYLNNNRAGAVVFLLYILVNLALALYVIIYRSAVLKDSVFVTCARAAGMLLNFNCTLIIVVMLKQTILFIRSKNYLRQWIPVDSYVDFHKFVGRFILVLFVLHVVPHMINFGQHSGE